jgi:uncharacterized protein YjiS (DUF1127 family)
METAMTTARYPVLPVAAGTLARVLVALIYPVVLSAKSVARSVRNRREALVLARLDQHMLADIGLTRSDINDAFSTPLWEDPTALLNERAIERRMNRAVTRVTKLTVVEKGAFLRPPAKRPSREAV